MTSVARTASLYQEDFVRWSEEQASALRDAARSGTNLPLDWENLAEEVESLGTSQRTELRSRIRNIIEHLLKLRSSPAVEPRRGWVETVQRERTDLELLLQGSPSLRREIARIIAEQTARAARLAVSSLEAHGEAGPAVVARIETSRFTDEQIVGDWIPNAPDST